MEFVLFILFIGIAIIGILPDINEDDLMEKYCKLECKRDILHKHCC